MRSEPQPEPLEVGDRVHVIYEIRRVHPPRGGERSEAIRRFRARRTGDELRGRRERERVRRPVGRGSEREPMVGNGPRKREQVPRGDTGRGRR